MNESSPLLIQLKNQEKSAQNRLIYKYNSRILMYFRLRIKGVEDYEDLVQEVFASFFQAVRKNKILEDKFIGPFLFGIAKRTVYNYFYKKKKNDTIQTKMNREMLLSFDFEENSRLENEQISTAVSALMEKLPDMDRTILREFYLNENTVGDIACLLGKSKHYISVRKLRAIKKLKNEIMKRKDLYIL